MGKLNVYRNADPKELAELHPADRLMVKLIQIDRLAPRIEGMLYKCAFEERWALLDDVNSFLYVCHMRYKHLFLGRTKINRSW